MNIKLKGLVQALKESTNEETDKELVQAIFTEMCASIEQGGPFSIAPKGSNSKWPERVARTFSLIGTELVKHELAGEALKRIKDLLQQLF